MFNPFTIFSKFKMALVAGAAGVMVILGIYAKGQSDGKTKARAEAAEDTVESVKAGTAGATRARKAQKDGRAPEEGVRSRDGEWQ